MKPRIDRLSTTRPKKPLRSPGTNQRGLACFSVFVVMGSLLRGCAARPHPPPAFAGAGSSGTFSRYAGNGLDDTPSPCTEENILGSPVERQSVVWGKSVSGRLDRGGRSM